MANFTTSYGMNVTAIYDTNYTTNLDTNTVKIVKASPGLLPGWPGCKTSPTRLPPGTLSKVNDWIVNIMLPIIVVFGVCGNILTISILIRSIKTKISSTTLYLLLLAVSDTLLILNGPLRQWIRLSWKYDFRTYHEAVCKLGVWLTYGSLQFSSWLLVALTLERVVSVLWPHRVKTSCTASGSRIICGALFLCIFGLNAHSLYGLGNSKLSYFSNIKRCSPLYEDYALFFLQVWHWINFVTAFAAPFVILAVGNCIIIYQIKKAYSSRKKMSTKGSTGSSQEKNTITRVMILLNVVFFISQTPASIYFIYIPYRIKEVNLLACDDYPEYTHQAEVIWLIYTVVNMLGYLNATVNFLLYVISGAKFRAEMKALLLCRKSPSSGGLFESSASVRGSRHSRRGRKISDNKTQVVKTISTGSTSPAIGD